MQLLGFWNFFVFFFRLFLLKLIELFELKDFLVKVEKKYRGVFSTNFVPLISILAPKIMKNEIIKFRISDFCKLLRLPVTPILKIQLFPLVC